MAFMAMNKNLNEKARKKEFDEIFIKFDHNKNGCTILILLNVSTGKFSRKNVCQRLFEGNKDASRESW